MFSLYGLCNLAPCTMHRAHEASINSISCKQTKKHKQEGNRQLHFSFSKSSAQVGGKCCVYCCPLSCLDLLTVAISVATNVIFSITPMKGHNNVGQANMVARIFIITPRQPTPTLARQMWWPLFIDSFNIRAN